MKKSFIFSFSLLGQIGFAVAIPLVVMALIGKWLDNKFGTSPYLLITGIALATIEIFFYMKKIIKQATKDFNNINE